MPDVSSGGLPRPLTSFIGRERELAQARRLLAASYLVTLTGPGGSGKTRLGIALAAEVAGDYPDGVYFVPLAPVRDPGLVPSSIESFPLFGYDLADYEELFEEKATLFAELLKGGPVTWDG